MYRNKPKLSLYFCLLFLIYSSVTQSQSYLVQTEQLSIKDGLSNRFVRSIVQDSKGFMWFGTKNGLNRYDGYTFTVFTQRNSKIQSDFIDKVFEDSDNNLWVGHVMKEESTESFSAIDILNINTFEIQSLETYLETKLPCTVDDIYEIRTRSDNKDLYITTKKGKVYVYKGNKQFELLYEHDIATTVRAFFWGEQYNWLYCGNELIALDKAGKVKEKHLVEIDESYRCNFIVEENGESIWLETNDKYHLYDLIYWNVETNFLEKNRPFKLLDTEINIGVNARLRYREKTNAYLYQDRGAFHVFDANQEKVYSKSFLENKHFIRAVYVDRQENIWLGAIAEGIIKISYQKNKFKPYLPGASTRSMIELLGDSVLLLNSYSGQYAYNRLTDERQLLDTLSYLDATESRDGKYIWLSSAGIHALKMEKQAPFKKQPYVYKKKYQISKGGKSSIYLGEPWSIHEDINGQTWIGTVNGLRYIKKGADSISIFKEYGDCPELRTAVVNCLYGNKQGLWLGTSKGLYLMNLTTEKFQRHSKEMKAPYNLPFNYIHHIFEDKNGFFWLSTRGGGVLKLELETGAFKQFTKKDGLSHNVVYAVLEDAYGYFWMSSDYGLMRLNPQNNVINTYLTEDGILHKEFNRKSVYKASNGMLYFGGLSGIVGFDPADFLIENKQVVPLHVVKYQYFNGKEGVLKNTTKQFLKEQEIVLDYTDRFFIVELALLDYIVTDKRQYAYKIEGLETDWNFITSNSIRVNGLKAGNYTLLIKGQGSNGLWSTEALKIPILVKQPFYLTWQFLLFVVISLLVVILVYSRWRVQRLYRVQIHLEKEVSKRTQKIEQQADELRELDDVKSRFFANISHELRTPLTLMLGPISAILNKHYGEEFEDIEDILELVKRNGIQLQHLIEEILILSKLEAQSVELDEKELCLLPFLKRIFFAFEAQANLQGLDWSFNGTIEEELYVLLDANKFEKILNNLLSNALKHTPRGGVVTFKIDQEKIEGEQINLLIEVVDSGKGIHPDDFPYVFDRFYQSKRKEAIIQGGTGIGLALTQEFVQLLKGSIKVESELNKGARFILSIPSLIIKDPKIDLEVENTEVVVLASLSPKNENTATVLIVEDNKDMCTFLVDLLEPYYNTITAENGRVGLDILTKKGTEIDLIVSDVMMPEMDGFELLQKVKSHSDWQQLPMVMLTARASEEDKLFALRIGVDDYLQKPFSPQELLVRLQNLLQNYTQRKASQLEKEEEEEIEIKPSETTFEIEDQWMESLETITKREVGNTQFGITSLAYDLNISERQLRRKIKMKTGLTPNQYFRIVKLDKAREYLEKRRYETVSEIAYKIGFSNVHYFSKIYQEQYGKKPSEYLKD
jgi:signal transduction histidine kinase/DNA-binding response OmpR family regulator/ligand-binding sensor domain-containing protein